MTVADSRRSKKDGYQPVLAERNTVLWMTGHLQQKMALPPLPACRGRAQSAELGDSSVLETTKLPGNRSGDSKDVKLLGQR